LILSFALICAYVGIFHVWLFSFFCVIEFSFVNISQVIFVGGERARWADFASFLYFNRLQPYIMCTVLNQQLIWSVWRLCQKDKDGGASSDMGGQELETAILKTQETSRSLKKQVSQ